MWEVVIAGAGPGGAAVAAGLAAREPGLVGKILVVDRETFPRAKPCGGGLTGHAAEAMAALGLELKVDSVAADDGLVRFGRLERRVKLPRPVRVVRREDFDASLLDEVRARGVEVREGVALEDVVEEDGGVRLRVGGEELRARVLVGADGAGSLVRKRLRGTGVGGARPGTPIRLFRAELPAPPDWRGRTEMLYDFTAMTAGLRGYVWIFPVPDDRINVGLMHAPGASLSGAQLTEILRGALRPLGVTLPEKVARGWPAWGYDGASPVSGAHLLTVGDAAGIDALTGEGIAVALEHAAICVPTILEGLSSGDLRFRHYRRALRQATVGRELTLDARLAWMLYGKDRWRTWLPLVLFDDEMLTLYAARVAGGLVLADQRGKLLRAFFGHMTRMGARKRALAEALAP
jgi:flavin-dependent dehydrogenase